MCNCPLCNWKKQESRLRAALYVFHHYCYFIILFDVLFSSILFSTPSTLYLAIPWVCFLHSSRCGTFFRYSYTVRRGQSLQQLQVAHLHMNVIKSFWQVARRTKAVQSGLRLVFRHKGKYRATSHSLETLLVSSVAVETRTCATKRKRWFSLASI